MNTRLRAIRVRSRNEPDIAALRKFAEIIFEIIVINKKMSVKKSTLR